MFKKPEEIILAILAVAWIVLTYFINHWLGVNSGITIQIMLYNMAWVVIIYIVWKKDKIYSTWPIFIGFLMAAWTPILTWYAQKNAGYTSNIDLVCGPMPWFATWYFKFGLVISANIIAYIILLLQHRKK